MDYFEPDYYELLGICKDAKKDEIKRSYKKMAMKYHPDKNLNDKEKAAEKFMLITKAYNTLMDDDLRDSYDRGGDLSMQKKQWMYSHLDDMYDRFYGSESKTNPIPKKPQFSKPMFRPPPANPTPGGIPRQGPYLSKQAGSFQPGDFARFGGPQPIQPTKPPTKMDLDTDPSEWLPPLIGPINVHIFCTLEDLCNGITIKRNVARCRDGVIEHKNFIITLYPGFPSDGVVTAPGQGNKMKGKPPEDINFKIFEIKHRIFKRVGSDILQTVEISFRNALLGYTWEGMAVSGEYIKKVISGPIQNEEEVPIFGAGMPIHETNERGKHILKFRIQMPIEINDRQKAVIEKLF